MGPAQLRVLSGLALVWEDYFCRRVPAHPRGLKIGWAFRLAHADPAALGIRYQTGNPALRARVVHLSEQERDRDSDVFSPACSP